MDKAQIRRKVSHLPTISMSNVSCTHLGDNNTNDERDPTLSFSFDRNDDADVLTKRLMEDTGNSLKDIFLQESDSSTTVTAEDEVNSAGHITRPFLRKKYEDDGDQECIARTPTEVAASIFRQRQQQKEENGCNTIPPNLSSEGSLTLGNLVESLWDYCGTHSQHQEGCGNNASEEENTFDPIPLRFWQASGVPVGISANSEEDDTMRSSVGCGGAVAIQSAAIHSLMLENSTEKNQNKCDSVLESLTLQHHSEGRSLTVPDLLDDNETDTFCAQLQCISPDPVKRSGKSGMHGTKRNQQTTTSDEEEHGHREGKRIKLLPNVIGPDAPQMTPVHRLMESLKCDDSNAEMCDRVKKIIEECQLKHAKGYHNYKNLPGAIFDRISKELGASEFQRLFRISQDYGNTIASSLTEASPPRIAETQHVTKFHTPSVVEAAVGYGFHLARIHFMHDSETNSSMHELLQQGVETVTRMSKVERTQFWKFMIDSSLYQRPGTGSQEAARRI